MNTRIEYHEGKKLIVQEKLYPVSKLGELTQQLLADCDDLVYVFGVPYIKVMSAKEAQ